MDELIYTVLRKIDPWRLQMINSHAAHLAGKLSNCAVVTYSYTLDADGEANIRPFELLVV